MGQVISHHDQVDRLPGVPRVNVRAAGAKGDGVTDDTAVFSAALSVANRRVYVPPGTYLIAKVLFAADGTTLEGDGYGSCLKLKPGLATGNPVLYVNKGGAKYRTGVTIRNLRIDGNAASGYANAGAENEGINADNTKDLTVENCWIENCGPDAIDCDGENVGLKILNNRVRDCGNGGMHLYGMKGGLVHGNYIENCGRNWTTANTSAAPSAIDVITEQQEGVAVAAADHVVISDNVIKDCNHGINVASGSHVVVRGNVIDNMDANGQAVAGYGAGVSVNPNVTYCIVEGNVIDTTYTDGIYGAAKVTRGNIVAGAGRATGNATARRGISASSAEVPLVEGNYVYDTLGIGIYASAKAVVSGNQIDTTTAEGVSFNTAAGSEARDNVIRAAGTYGILATFRATIIGNTIDGAAENAIGVSTSSADKSVVRNNTVLASTKTGILIASASVQVTGNYVTGVGAGTFFGINANGAAAGNCQIVGNYCTGNPFGIGISASTTGWYVAGNKCHTNSTADFFVSGTAGAGRLSHDNDFVTFSGSYMFGSATFNPASLADGAGETTTVACTGAAMGDYAQASFSLDTTGITITAGVSTAGTVSVRFQNESGGVLDIGSGTLRVKVTR